MLDATAADCLSKVALSGLGLGRATTDIDSCGRPPMPSQLYTHWVCGHVAP